MPNEEVLGPRKTMFVIVIVVGCFAVLWPRILSPLLLGHTREQLKPNQFDREAAIKQERPGMRAGTHPALRERGRAIPAGTPSPPRPPITMPPHVRVRNSPLSVYYELDIKPPPIPGMRPPLGSPGGPVPAPKSSMGFVMPIYTICIIVFFVYTLSKILFKRTGSTTYEAVTPDPQFRRRVFRDDSRTSPDQLGPRERDTIVTAISGLVAEVRQQMEASYAQNQQRQDLQDNHARPYTNGTVLHNSGPVHIVASEYTEEPKEKSPEPTKEPSPEPAKEPTTKEPTPEPTPEPKEPSPIEETSPEREVSSERDESLPELKETSPEHTDTTVPTKENNADLIEFAEVAKAEEKAEDIKATEEFLDKAREVEVVSTEDFEEGAKEKRTTPDLLEEALKEDSSEKEDDEEEEIEEEVVEGEPEKPSVKVVGMEVTAHTADGGEYRPLPAPAPAPAPAPPRAHEADAVKSIFLETQIPQQSRVLVAEFEDDARQPAGTKHSPMVVSGKMTLSLIQDAPRDTPDRDLESTVDDYTTASAVTQPAAEKDGELSDEEIEEEIEIEEIEEEVEEEEEEEEEPQKAQPQAPAKKK